MATIKTGTITNLPFAGNPADSAVVTVSSDLNLITESIAAGDLFKYSGLLTPSIYTVKTRDSAVQITLNEKVRAANVEQPFIIIPGAQLSASLGLYLPQKGDPDWKAFVRRNMMKIDVELNKIPAIPPTTDLNIVSASDNVLDLNPGKTTWLSIPPNTGGGGFLSPKVTTPVVVSSNAYIEVGASFLMEAGPNASLHIEWLWGNNADPPTVWHRFGMLMWPSDAVHTFSTGKDYWQVSDHIILPGPLTAATTYSFRMRLVEDISSASTDRLDFADSTNNTIRKLWCAYHDV